MKLLPLFFIILTIQKVTGQQVNVLGISNSNENCRTVLLSKYFYEDNEFCFSSLLLNKDSTFQLENGCENQSTITLGQWDILDDSIKLTPFQKEDLKPICSFEVEKKNNNKNAEFVIIDNVGNPVKGFIIIAYKKDSINTNKSLYDLYEMQDKREVFIYETDTNGIAKINLNKIETIEFYSLNFMCKKNYWFSKKLISSYNRVTLAFNRIALENFIQEYKSFDMNTIYYKISKDKKNIGCMKLTR